MEYWYDTRIPLLILKHSLQSPTLERLGHCAVIVEDGLVAVEELPEKLLPENDVVIELLEAMSPEGATSVGGVGVAPRTNTTSNKSSPRVWILIIGVPLAGKGSR
jgi:hypothetical protein